MPAWQPRAFAGPEAVCVEFLNWQAALAGLDDLKLVAQPLRVRQAADLGWKPGCWLLSDHENPPEEPRKRSLLASIVGR